MTLTQVINTLRGVGFSEEVTGNLLAATIRARKSASRYPRIKCGWRIVLRSNGVARCECNTGRVRGGLVVATVGGVK
jgi:hypothetical protein